MFAFHYCECTVAFHSARSDPGSLPVADMVLAAVSWSYSELVYGPVGRRFDFCSQQMHVITDQTAVKADLLRKVSNIYSFLVFDPLLRSCTKATMT